MKTFKTIFMHIRIQFLRSQKIEPEGGEQHGALNFFLIPPDLLLFIDDIFMLTFCLHFFFLIYVLHTKPCCVNKKIISHKNYAVYQNYVRHKKHYMATKKFLSLPKESLMLLRKEMKNVDKKQFVLYIYCTDFQVSALNIFHILLQCFFV